MDEQGRAAQLGRAWDTFKRGDLVECDPADLALVRSLIALDRQSTPDPRFVARLEGALMMPGAAPQMPPDQWSPAQVAGSRVDPGDVWSLPVWSRRPSWTRWAVAAAVIVLTCGALVFLTLQTGSGDDDRPTSLPAYGDASSTALTWQETPECDVPARPRDSFRTLLALSAGDMTPTPPPDEIGATANISTVAAIEATVRELVSCHNAQQPGRYYALWTNTAILWTNRVMSNSQDGMWLQSIWQAVEATEVASGTPESGAPVEIWTVSGVEDIAVLSDGRIRAAVRYGTTRGEFAVLTHFAQRDGTYLLDAAAGWTYGGSAALHPWSSLLATPDPVAETDSTRPRVSSGDTGATMIQGPVPAEGPFIRTGPGGEVFPPMTSSGTSIGDDSAVRSEPVNPGDTSAGSAVGGAAGDTMSSQPTPVPAGSVYSGSTSGGNALGWAAGGNVPLEPTPGSAND